MFHRRCSVPALGLMVLFVLSVTTCRVPVSPASARSGSLQVAVASAINARTLLPSIDMTVASYAITGTGPNGAGFTATSTGEAVTESGLAFGTWTVVVDATNASGQLIGTGSATAQVTTGETASVSVSVTPIAGTGMLSLGVSWPASQVQTPSISATLTPALGAAQELAFDISGSSASYTNGSVGNGYYTLAFTLKDNGIAVAGAVEVVRIVAGATTSGSYGFSNVNAPGGTLQVNITPAMADPLAVSITGGQETQGAGSTQALSAGVSNFSGNVVYVWYVNGASAGTGQSFLFGAGMAAGYYRVDVTAFSADGTRGGSATLPVQVSGNPPITFSNLGVTGTIRDHDVTPDGRVLVLSQNGGNVIVDAFGADGSNLTGPVAVGVYNPVGVGNTFAVFASRVSRHVLVVWRYSDAVAQVEELRYAYLDQDCHPLVTNRAIWTGIYCEFFDAKIDDAGRAVVGFSSGTTYFAAIGADGSIQRTEAAFNISAAYGTHVAMNKSTGAGLLAAQIHSGDGIFYRRFDRDLNWVDPSPVQMVTGNYHYWYDDFTVGMNDLGDFAFIWRPSQTKLDMSFFSAAGARVANVERTTPAFESTPDSVYDSFRLRHQEIPLRGNDFVFGEVYNWTAGSDLAVKHFIYSPNGQLLKENSTTVSVAEGLTIRTNGAGSAVVRDNIRIVGLPSYP